MYYAPHKLQKRVIPSVGNDEYGRPLETQESEEWVDVCECRCDVNSTKEIALPDGRIVRPDYHIVMGESEPDVAVGDYIRCIWKVSGKLKGEGKVINRKPSNLLPYAEIYV